MEFRRHNTGQAALAWRELLFRPELGSLVFFQGSDDIWYRGEVLSADGEAFKFFGVDFGFTETVSLTRVREIQQEYMKEANFFGKND